MASEPLTVDSLPSEILISILSPFSTPSLLRLAAVNRRFHAIVLRLLHSRLLHATSLSTHQVILESYHPSEKLSTPYLYCDYLGTNGLDLPPADSTAHENVVRVAGAEESLSLPEMRGLYSRFRPQAQEEARSPRARYPRRPSSSAQSQQQDREQGSSSAEAKPASHDVHLDEGELFSQLCAVTNLVKVGPRRGLFHSCVNLGDGVVRVWRNWLAANAETGSGSAEEAILWADASKDVGLRFRVCEVADTLRPVLANADEDLPVSYRLEYEELLVRTTKLVLTVEESEVQEVTHSGFHFEPRGKASHAAQTLFYWAMPPAGYMMQPQLGMMPLRAEVYA